jgi:hypothetical protein
MLKEEHGVEVSLDLIKVVFKKDLSLSFRRIKKIPCLGNSERCLVMRNLYARKMIDLQSSGKTIWNFDESFIKDSFFVRKMWGKRGQPNSMPK